MKNEKKQKNKIPFYVKPFQKLLTTSTNITLSYLYEYSQKNYNETLPYEEWLYKVKEFMKTADKNIGEEE